MGWGWQYGGEVGQLELKVEKVEKRERGLLV